MLCRLQTDKEYINRGYATLVTKYLSKQLAESGYDVYAAIFENNQASRNLFTKLGFQPTTRLYFNGSEINWSMTDE